MAAALNTPYGGKLVDRMSARSRDEILREAAALPDVVLGTRQICDLELILNGGFSPLTGFMGKAAYEGVVSSMRLPQGRLWPMPITLDVDPETAKRVSSAGKAALRSPEGSLLAILSVSDVWTPDRAAEAQAVFGTIDPLHPGAAYLLQRSGPVYIGGDVEGVEFPRHYDFEGLRRTPRQLRELLEREGRGEVVAFQTRNPMHRAHLELTTRAAKQVGAHLLIHPVVGQTKPGDVDYFTRVRCYRRLMARYPKGQATLSLLPLAMRMGGPREALWHAIIRRNYGCSHLIVGRDHAGPGKDGKGQPFYAPYASQELLGKHQEEIGVRMVPFEMLVYLPGRDAYVQETEVPSGEKAASISGTELRRRLATGEELPEWFTYPEIAEELRRQYPPREKQGMTLFFTGLSGSGKSTIAQILQARLMESDARRVTMLDGDVVRTNLSSELGFSKEHRSLNIRRIGFVAAEATRHGGTAICCPIAPYEEDRAYNRQMISALGAYVEIHVATPLEVCEKRDRKGLYRKAREGKLKGFTGIDDPYEAPKSPEVVLDTVNCDAQSCAEKVLAYLRDQGLIRAEP